MFIIITTELSKNGRSAIVQHMVVAESEDEATKQYRQWIASQEGLVILDGPCTAALNTEPGTPNIYYIDSQL